MIEFRTGTSVSESAIHSYEAIYAAQSLRQLESFYQWAMVQADIRPGHRVLDAACGTGELVHLASSMGARVVGVDFASHAIIRGKRDGVQGSLLVANGEALPFADSTFDRVVSLGSLEHYEAPAIGVREMARVLRSDGTALIVVPNAFSYLHVLYVWRNGKVFDDGQPIQRYATEHAWRQLLETHGLHVTRVAKHQTPLPHNWSDLIWYLRHPRGLLRALVTPLLPLNAASLFVFDCVKPTSG